MNVPSVDSIALGLRANWRQFALLVAVNAFVGATIGMERSLLPVLGKEEFGLTSKTAVVSFIASFGIAKAATNLLAGRLAERLSRRRVLIAGWLFALPVPLILIWAPSWGWVIAANLLLGVNQGLAWSMTINMKLDLAGPKRRGFALGMNEAAGYVAVAAAALLSGVIAERYGLRPEPFYLMIGFAAAGLALSAVFVRDTSRFVRFEGARHEDEAPALSLRRSFAEMTWRRPYLFGIAQAGFVTNLNDGLAWGIFPLFFLSRGLSLERIALLAAIYPLVWGILQLGTGWVSDLLDRRPIIVAGMLLQGAAIAMVALSDAFAGWLTGAVLLGVGTALVYPTLLAAVGDAVHPGERATSLGVYRFWRDGGAVVGALTAGALADLFGFHTAIYAVAGVTAASGGVAARTLRSSRPASTRVGGAERR